MPLGQFSMPLLAPSLAHAELPVSIDRKIGWLSLFD
jgi:hypothetical protein